MRKLKLELDELSVESFEVAEKAEERGTVHGNVFMTQFCTGANGVTCGESCGTCVGTCVNESCDTCVDLSCDTCNSGCYMTPPTRYTAYYDELTMCVYA